MEKNNSNTVQANLIEYDNNDTCQWYKVLDSGAVIFFGYNTPQSEINEAKETALRYAASKDMYEALQGFVHWWDNSGQPDECRNNAMNAKAALQKAQGK